MFALLRQVICLVLPWQIFFYNVHMTPLELLDETVSIRVSEEVTCSKGCWVHVALSVHFTMMFRNTPASCLSVFVGV